VSMTWTPASSSSVPGFSAVCWFFGRHISDSLADVPIGLIQSAWGATSIQTWMPETAFEACGETGKGQGQRYNSMIFPFAVGPLSIAGFAWYQGENNVKHFSPNYGCYEKEMISEWRKVFDNSEAFFGFVQLSTFCAEYAVEKLPEIREKQMEALALPKVGYAVNADHGSECYIHPPSKQYPAQRLANSALALQYGKQVPWRSPSYVSAGVHVDQGAISVKVQLADVNEAGLTTDVYPFNYDTVHHGRFPYDPVDCAKLDADIPGTCAWASIHISGIGWVNATVTTTPDKSGLVLSASAPESTIGLTVDATAYAWGPIPLMNAYDLKSGLPVLPWNRTVNSSVQIMREAVSSEMLV